MYISDHIITSKHYLVHFVCAFAVGIYLAVSLGIIFTLCLTIMAFVLCGLICIILKIKKLFKKKYIILSVILTIATALGVFRIYCTEYIQSNYIRQYQDKEVWICGTVTSDPHTTSNCYYYTFELDVFGVADKTGNFGTITMYIQRDLGCDFKAGENIYAWTSLKVPESIENSSHLDYYTHLRGKNIFLIGTTKNINSLPYGIHPTLIISLKHSGAWLRSKITHSIDMIFPDNNLSNAVLKGILVGDKSGFDDELYQKFSYSGISHIVAVSGLHMSILFSLLMVFSRQLKLNKNLNLLITIPAIVLFMSASAFTPSVCRASIMILVMIFSTLFREKYNPVTSLFLALGLILSISPYALFSKSLVLSFSATLGIFAYFPYMYGILSQLVNPSRLKLKNHTIIKKGINFFVSSISLTASSLIGTAYFLVLFFEGISKVQFLTNLWIIPLVSIIFCLGYICCILYYLCPWLVLAILKYPLNWCLGIINFTIEKFGTAKNVLIIPSKKLNPVSAIIYFGIALMIYMFLKACQDIKTENKKAS